MADIEIDVPGEFARLHEAFGAFEAIRDAGAKPVLLVFPSVGQVDGLNAIRRDTPDEYDKKRGVIARIQSDLTAFCTEREVPVIDLLDAYIDSDVRPYGEVDTSHPSVHGYGLAVAELVPVVLARGVRGRPGRATVGHRCRPGRPPRPGSRRQSRVVRTRSRVRP